MSEPQMILMEDKINYEFRKKLLKPFNKEKQRCIGPFPGTGYKPLDDKMELMGLKPMEDYVHYFKLENRILVSYTGIVKPLTKFGSGWIKTTKFRELHLGRN